MMLAVSLISILAAVGIITAVFFYFQKHEPALPTVVTPEIPAPKPKPEISYHTLTIETTSPLKELSAIVGSDNVRIVLQLNHMDSKFIHQGSVLIVPDKFTNLMDISPFPAQITSAVSVPKLLLISQKVQSFGAYEYGQLVRTGSVSSGKQSTPTPSKLFFANWKGKEVISSVSDEWLLKWNFNLDNFEGIGIHQYEMPGYPASHSCVRLFESDAMWLYEWADQWILSDDAQSRLAAGTPVVIFGKYTYGEKAPWKLLPENPKATTLSENEIEKVLEEYLPKIHERVQQRVEVLAQMQ